MATFPIDKIEKSALTYWLVRLINFCICFVDFFLNLLLGWSFRKGTRQEQEEAKNYEKSAQLVSVLMRGIYADTYTVSPNNFVFKHIKYVDPKWILKNDKATIMGATKTHYFFCVTVDPKLDAVDTTVSPFMFALQFLYAQQLLIVPHATMHRLTDELGDPKAKVTFLDMTGRCGSTLICSMMNRVKGTRSFSEPWVYLHLHKQYLNGQISYEVYKRMLKSTTRILCRPENEQKVSHIIVKLTIFLNGQTPVLKEIFPNFKYMFISRHYKPCAKSWIKLIKSLPTFFTHTRWILVNFFFDHMPHPYGEVKWEKIRKEWRDHRGTTEDIILCFTMNFIAQMASFLKNKELYDHTILYEDLMADNDNEMKKIFDVMEVDPKFIPDAKKAFNFDSQRGKFGGRGTDHIFISEKQWKEIDDLFKEYNMTQFSAESSVDDLRKAWYFKDHL